MLVYQRVLSDEKKIEYVATVWLNPGVTPVHPRPPVFTKSERTEAMAHFERNREFFPFS